MKFISCFVCPVHWYLCGCSVYSSLLIVYIDELLASFSQLVFGALVFVTTMFVKCSVSVKGCCALQRIQL